jgi:hypothetical protein
MLGEPQCFARNCKHFLGVVQKEGDDFERTEKVVCAAFPRGIPDDIAYGDELHLQPISGDHGIQYEREE